MNGNPKFLASLQSVVQPIVRSTPQVGSYSRRCRCGRSQRQHRRRRWRRRCHGRRFRHRRRICYVDAIVGVGGKIETPIDDGEENDFS